MPEQAAINGQQGAANGFYWRLNLLPISLQKKARGKQLNQQTKHQNELKKLHVAKLQRENADSLPCVEIEYELFIHFWLSQMKYDKVSV